MKKIEKLGFQGDVAFVRLARAPKRGMEVARTTEGLIVAHSETGHHHVLEGEAKLFEAAERNPLVCFLRIDGDFGQVVHRRAFDTHETIALKKGWWKVVRQREYTPQGWRRVED